MKLDELDKQITSSDLEALETFADRIFAKVGIDVEFTRHFLDRVNDERNGKQITASELTRLFKQEYKRWGQPIAQMGPDAEAVMKDLQTDINMPFALVWDKENEELDLIVKTVMRKSNFKTSNREFAVEGKDYNLIAQRKTMNLSNQAIIALVASLYKQLDDKELNEEEEDCPACDGLGWDQSVTADEDDRGCDECGGTGKVNEAGFYMNGPSGLRHTPTQRSTHRTISLPLRGEPKLRPAHSNNMFRRLLKLNKDNKTDNETVNEDSQIWEWNKEDPNNPEVLIQGYGRLMLNQIEDSVVRKLEELTKMAERGDFEQIQSLLDRDVMQTMMKAIVDTKAELQATRKRGGPKSRGINKESILDVIGKSEIEELELKEFTLTDVKDMVKKGWMARPTEKQWKELIKIYNKYKGNVTRKDLIDLGIATIGRKESVEEAGGVGRVVPGINTSVDVGPNEIKKQAAKFGNAVDKDGVPKKNLR